MTLDLNVLKHLGINLYSNVAAVLTETVANSWDADAEHVDIKIDVKKGVIIIEDDGIGMSVADMNEKYLKVGYCRRNEKGQAVTKKGRAVMGRKGLGKLSLFSIANIVEVQSKQDGTICHGCRMSVEDMEKAVTDKANSYIPEPIPTEELTKTSTGTKLILKNLKKGRLKATIEALKLKLARRFSIIGEVNGQSFSVRLNDQQITIEDRADFKVTDFIWTFGDTNFDEPIKSSFKSIEILQNRESDWSSNWNIRGWIGTASTPKKLDDPFAGNLNGIVVLARGRLFHENILEKINDGRIYTKYLTGQIEADFLDDDQEEDIATSDRQRIKEDDPRYQHLLKFLKKQLNIIEKEWNDLRKQHEIRRLITESKGIKNWLNSLKPVPRKHAEKMLSNLSALPIEDPENRKNLFRHGILAFERMRLREDVESLSENIFNVDKLLELLADQDSFEASLYSDIVKSRLDAIRAFQNIVDSNQKEKVLQKYLFDHLWLLDPSWERATNTEIMEKRLSDFKLKIDDLSEAEKLGRVDIAYRSISNKDVIIELKKFDRSMKGGDLYEQGRKYVNTLKKIVKTVENRDAEVEVIFVLGKPIINADPESEKMLMNSISPGSRVVYYDELIHHAQQAYSEYTEKLKTVDKLEQFLQEV